MRVNTSSTVDILYETVIMAVSTISPFKNSNIFPTGFDLDVFVLTLLILTFMFAPIIALYLLSKDAVELITESQTLSTDHQKNLSFKPSHLEISNQSKYSQQTSYHTKPTTDSVNSDRTSSVFSVKKHKDSNIKQTVDTITAGRISSIVKSNISEDKLDIFSTDVKHLRSKAKKHLKEFKTAKDSSCNIHIETTMEKSKSGRNEINIKSNKVLEKHGLFEEQEAKEVPNKNPVEFVITSNTRNATPKEASHKKTSKEDLQVKTIKEESHTKATKDESHIKTPHEEKTSKEEHHKKTPKHSKHKNKHKTPKTHKKPRTHKTPVEDGSPEEKKKSEEKK